MKGWPDANLIFFFSSRRRHTRCGRDWSSDVCSSDFHHKQFDELAHFLFLSANYLLEVLIVRDNKAGIFQLGHLWFDLVILQLDFLQLIRNRDLLTTVLLLLHLLFVVILSVRYPLWIILFFSYRCFYFL